MRGTVAAMGTLSLANSPAAAKRPAEASPGASPDKAAASGATRRDHEVDEAPGIRALRHAPKMKKSLTASFGGARRDEEREPPAAAQ